MDNLQETFFCGRGLKKKKCERENLVFYNPPMNINCVISSGLNGRQGVALEAFRHICGPHTLSVLLDAM